jgi:hypothetical protein
MKKVKERKPTIPFGMTLQNQIRLDFVVFRFRAEVVVHIEDQNLGARGLARDNARPFGIHTCAIDFPGMIDELLQLHFRCVQIGLV